MKPLKVDASLKPRKMLAMVKLESLVLRDDAILELNQVILYCLCDIFLLIFVILGVGVYM